MFDQGDCGTADLQATSPANVDGDVPQHTSGEYPRQCREGRIRSRRRAT